MARDDERLLVLCHAIDLESLDLERDLVVTASWHRGDVHQITPLRITHLATYPVGTLVLSYETAPGPDQRRSAPRLHRVLPAQLWTPETGHLAATIVDISTGGARLRLRERPPSIECEAIVGCGDDPVEVRAKVLEIIPAGVAGRHHEVRLAFVAAATEAKERIDSAIRGGVTDAIAELGMNARSRH